jgi:uncharacterized protein YaaN involved in tellurite resistance
VTTGFTFPEQPTTATAEPPTGGFVFPKPTENLPVPAEPAGVASVGLQGVVADPAQRTALMCYQTFNSDILAKAKGEAAQLLPSMRDDSAAFINYGVDAMAALNQLVDKVLKEVEPVRIPEAQQGMQDLKRKMRAAQGKYDLSDPKTQERLKKAAELAGKPRKWFNKAGDVWAEFKASTEDIIKQIDGLEADLSGRAIQLARNAEFCVQLYNQNEAEIQNLIYVIGVMELVLELAQAQAQRIPDDEPNDVSKKNSELKGKYADMIRALDVKIGEYKSRMFVAWASAPQLRMMRQMDVDMAMKMHTLVQSALPTTKLVLVQWRMMLQGEENAKISEGVQDFTNDMVAGYFKTASQVMPQIAQSVQRQTITPETVNSVVDSLCTMVDGINDAYVNGQRNRQVMDETMIKAQKELTNLKDKVDDAVINDIVGAASSATYVRSERVTGGVN